MNRLTYKGYTARVEFDEADEIFVGRVLGVRDIIGFHGATVKELVSDFHHALDHYLAVCKKRGEQPEKPFSGRVLLRIAPETHAAAAVAAESEGKSLNQWAAEKLREAAHC